MIKQKIDRNYVSEIGKFIKEFDEKHPEKSQSQQAEIEKYNKIFEKRDSVVQDKSQLPDDF